MGNHLSGITCTPMGIYSQSFYVAMSLLSSPDANAYCAEFVVLSTCHCFGLFVTIMASKEDIQQLVKQKSTSGNKKYVNLSNLHLCCCELRTSLNWIETGFSRFWRMP